MLHLLPSLPFLLSASSHYLISLIPLPHPPQLCVEVSPTFIHYLQNYPMLLEVFGHYQQHPLHKASTELDPNK